MYLESWDPVFRSKLVPFSSSIFSFYRRSGTVKDWVFFSRLPSTWVIQLVSNRLPYTAYGPPLDTNWMIQENPGS